MDWYVSGPFRVRLLLGIMGVVCTSAGPFRVRMVIWDMVDRFYDRVYIYRDCLLGICVPVRGTYLLYGGLFRQLFNIEHGHPEHFKIVQTIII